MSRRTRMEEIYASGAIPWDEVDPPPEVLAEAAARPPGRALDLGAGLGRTALYLGRLGWQVDGIDFIPEAVAEATRRAVEAGLGGQVRFYEAAVTGLDFLVGPYDLAVDVGCAHGLNAGELAAYHAGLKRLLPAGARYLLFAHLDDQSFDSEGTRWLNEAAFYALFADGFLLERAEHGETVVNGQAPWRSAWFWWRREDRSARVPA